MPQGPGAPKRTPGATIFGAGLPVLQQEGKSSLPNSRPEEGPGTAGLR